MTTVWQALPYCLAIGGQSDKGNALICRSSATMGHPGFGNRGHLKVEIPDATPAMIPEEMFNAALCPVRAVERGHHRRQTRPIGLVRPPSGQGPDRHLTVEFRGCQVPDLSRFSQQPGPPEKAPMLICLLCPSWCPANRPFFQWFEESESFSEPETELILKGSSRQQLPEATVTKLERLYFLDDLNLLPRNLRALIDRAP